MKIENDVKIVCLIKFFRGNVDFFCIGWYIKMNVFFNLKNNYVFLIDVYEINKLDCDEWVFLNFIVFFIDYFLIIVIFF